MAETAAVEAATTNPGFELSDAGRPKPGRPAAHLAELFDAHASMVLGLCRSLLRDRHEAEDAAQQTFLSAYASLLAGTIPREPAAWLATIARNECRTRAQRRMREPLPVADTEETAVDAFASAAEVESLRIALAELPGQQRRAFLLREFNGLSYAELAVALGVTRPAVESLLFRARQQLRGRLRAAAAALISVPTSVRDLVAQFAGGSGDGAGPATLAKMASIPLGLKLAAVGAGGMIGAAGVVAVRHVHPDTVPTAKAAKAAVKPAPVRQPAATSSDDRLASAPRPLARTVAPVKTVETAPAHPRHETGQDAARSQPEERHSSGGSGDHGSADGSRAGHETEVKQPSDHVPSTGDGGGQSASSGPNGDSSSGDSSAEFRSHGDGGGSGDGGGGGSGDGSGGSGDSGSGSGDGSGEGSAPAPAPVPAPAPQP